MSVQESDRTGASAAEFFDVGYAGGICPRRPIPLLAALILVTGSGSINAARSMPLVGTSPTIRFDDAVELGIFGNSVRPLSSMRDQVDHLTYCLSLQKTDLARILGVSRTTIYAWIAGAQRPRISSIRLMKRLLEVADAVVRMIAKPLNARLVREHRLGSQTLLEYLHGPDLELATAESFVESIAAAMAEREGRKASRRLEELGIDVGGEEAQTLDRNLSTM